MKIITTLAMACIAAIAFAQTPAQTPPSGSEFLKKAMQGNTTEIEAGELAANKATSDAVKKLGQMMAEQHSGARDKVAALAKRKNVELPKEISEQQKDVLEKLQAAEGPRFDQEYVAEMVKAHEATIQMLNTEIETGRDADTKALAQELLPTVKAHLSEANRLAGKEDSASQMPQ
jgi:putative membrane protein